MTPDELLAKLTPSERRVALLLAQGKTQRQIARALELHTRTVFVHAHNAVLKTQCSSVFELAVRLAVLGKNYPIG